VPLKEIGDDVHEANQDLGPAARFSWVWANRTFQACSRRVSRFPLENALLQQQIDPHVSVFVLFCAMMGRDEGLKHLHPPQSSFGRLPHGPNVLALSGAVRWLFWCRRAWLAGRTGRQDPTFDLVTGISPER